MKTDDKTLAIIREINKQKAEISKIEKPSWKTNCSFSYTEGGTPFNLNVVADVSKLVSMAAFLINSENAYEEAKSRLDVSDAPAFSWLGFSIQDWLADIKARIDKVQIVSKKKKLEALEARASAIISPEKRAELELEAIMNDFGSM